MLSSFLKIRSWWLRRPFRRVAEFFVLTLVWFAGAKLVFVLYNGSAVGVRDVLRILWNGLPLDVATAGYVVAPLWLATGVGLFWRSRSARWLYLFYCGVLALALALVFVGDTALYAFWGVKLDATVFNYLSQPQGITDSVSTLYVLTAVAAVLLTAALLFWGYRRLGFSGAPLASPRRGGWRRVRVLSFHLLLGGLLFLGIRGGVGRSTANVGMVYFSNRLFLNHAAVNPAFSLLSSLGKADDYASRFDAFAEPRRDSLFRSLGFRTADVPLDTLLTTSRPNVLIVLMEGLGATFVEALGGTPGVTPHLNRLAKEGVLFTQCYANSFRTDRGTVCTFSGYPGFPTVSPMRVQRAVNRLPGIARSLAAAGYATDFLYGGDINFTGTKGYLLATGYRRLTSIQDFPLTVRRTHAWGVTDALTFDRLLADLSARPLDRPWHTAFLTLASHEPWEVPYNRFPHNKMENGMAYLDDCIGRFVEAFRRTPQWKNTLIVFLPDHGIIYPEDIVEENPRKHHIPLLWVGGAVRRPRVVGTLCNQSDLAATLLGQLRLPHADFTFSRDVFGRAYRPSAFYTWNEGAAYLTPSGTTLLNLNTDRCSSTEPVAPTLHAERLRAYLQTIYDDLGR